MKMDERGKERNKNGNGETKRETKTARGKEE